LAGGTDGEDGPTDAAGALIDVEIVETMHGLQLDPAMYLANNDAYHFFQQLAGLIQTGPTHTNVCDLRVVTVSQPPVDS
jgi:hydroxypyruvate reductase